MALAKIFLDLFSLNSSWAMMQNVIQGKLMIGTSHSSPGDQDIELEKAKELAKDRKR
jgi:hypothetical protein